MIRFLAVSGVAIASQALGANSGSGADFYHACPGQDAIKGAKLSWDQKIDSALDRHRELRAAWNSPMPKGESRVLVYWMGGDLETSRTSVIAVRKTDGLWHTTQVGDSVVWIKGAKPTPIPFQEKDLRADESSRLDALLNDACLYAGPTWILRPVVGGGISTLEIETPKHHWRASWAGALTDQERALLELIDIRG